MSTLHVGDIVDVPGLGLCEVVLVNACRARVKPLTKTVHALVAKRKRAGRGPDGKPRYVLTEPQVREFATAEKPQDISPTGVGLRMVKAAARPKRTRVKL